MLTKLVESNHYHIWTDAIHARELSRQTNNKWDRGTYVRWAIITSWIAFEMACQDALNNNTISYNRFRENLDKAIASKKLPALDWSQGIWQKVIEAQNLRKNVIHRFASEKHVFPEIEISESTIGTIREAIKAIYRHCNKSAPEWVEDDADEGWTTGTFMCHGTMNNSPYYKMEGAIKVAYLYQGREYIYDYLSPETDVTQPIENIFKGVGKPITAVRLYRDDEVIVEYLFDETKIRGA